MVEVKKAYKKTEIGIIPDDWEVKSLGNLGETLIGLTYKPENVSEFGTLVLRSSNINNGRLSYNDNVYVKMDLPERVIVKNEDILICVRNGSKQLIGKCAFIDNLVSGSAFGAFMSIFRSKYSKFIFYQFKSDIIKKQINEVMGATINQITNKNMASFKIPFPPNIKEQKAIAEVLSDVDSLIISLEKLIAKKRDIKTATMQELLTGKKRLSGFDKNKDYKKTEIGIIPDDWEVKSLGDVFNISAGGDFNKKTSNEFKTETYPYPIYSNTASNNGLYGFSNYFTNNSGSITVTARGTLGLANFRDHNFIAIGRVLILEPKILINCKFISEYINNKITFVLESTGVPQLTAPQISKYLIANPPLSEQKAIAEVLSDMDNEILKLEIRLEKTKNIKQGMMQKLLTGRTRLV